MKKKILLVNQDKNTREIFQMYLDLKNYESYEASNGLEGLEKAKEILPDLILLGVVLPGLNGYDLCLMLKQEQRTKDIPILFLSSLLGTNEKIRGLGCGASDFINNLADYEEILARIETHLKIKELTYQLKTTNQELQLKQKSLSEDLRAAASIQESLLPTRNLQIPNLDVSWLYKPSELIGGDLCGISKLTPETFAFYVLDVSGHGVPSAMVTVSLTQYLQQRQSSDPTLSPKQIMRELNHEYPFEKFNMFLTIFYMVFNTLTNRLTYCNAGHPPAIYLQPTHPFQLLSLHGPLIGVESDYVYEEVELSLQEGDKIILYTDGILELSNPQNQLYGSERFYALLEEFKALPMTQIFEKVSEALKTFGEGQDPRDDRSLLGIERIAHHKKD